MGTPTIGTIEECPDLFADACVCNDTGDLVFLSVWGRDTAIQELLGRITLSSVEPLAIQRLHLDWGSGQSQIALSLDQDQLEKRLGRGFSDTLFGSLSHLWLFDRLIIEPNYANASAYVLSLIIPGKTREQMYSVNQAMLWSHVIGLAPFPILEHWGGPVMAEITRHNMIRPLVTCFGPLQGWRIDLAIESLQGSIGQLIRAGRLTVTA